MKLCRSIIIVGIGVYLAQNIIAEPVIMAFLRPYPGDKQYAQQLVNKLKKPSNLAKRAIESAVKNNIITGIFSTYAGYLQVSNLHGQIIFPRKHVKPFLNLIITNKITPILMFDNTISHWELDTSAQAVLYTAEIKEDEKTQRSFWNIQQADLPDNNQIPLESLIIIAKPQNIYVPTGITFTTPQPHLLLPDMYLKKGINIVRNAFYILNLSHFFRPPQILYKKQPTRYSSLLEG